MILLLVLILALSASFYLFWAQTSLYGASAAVAKITQKERDFVLLKSAVSLAVKLLKEKTNGGLVSLSGVYFKPLSFDTPVGTVTVKIVDLDRFLNLNRLSNRYVRQTFENLLTELDIDPLLLESLLQWEGLKTNYYNWGSLPIKGAPLDSKYELLYVWNNTGDLFGKEEGGEKLPGLLQLVTVHSSGKININTAPFWVIKALPGMDEATASQILELRKEKNITNLNQLLGVGSINMDYLFRLQQILTTRSRFFKVDITLNGTSTSTTLWFIYDLKKNRIVEKGVY